MLKNISRVNPDVLLVDIGLPGMSGIDGIKQVKALLPDLESTIKCACTEFANKLGDPAKWIVTDKQLQLESLLREWLAVDENVYTQPPYLKAYIVKKWREFSEKHAP